MSVDEGARRVVESMAGRLLLSAAVTVTLGFSGWTASQINTHSEKLSGISQKLDDLVVADTERSVSDDARAKTTGEALDRLLSDDQIHSIAIARAEEKIEEIQRERALPPRIERESLAIPAPSPPAIIAPVIKALSHVFSPPRRVFTRHRARN